LVAGSSIKVGAELETVLPALLWLYQLGVVLYWIHDTSPDNARTLLLVDHTVSMITRLVRMSRLPVVRPLSRQTAELITMPRTRQPS
jgi:hypothetical protein